MTKPNSYYLREIEKISLLTVEEEKALATKASSGDPDRGGQSTPGKRAGQAPRCFGKHLGRLQCV